MNYVVTVISGFCWESFTKEKKGKVKLKVNLA